MPTHTLSFLTQIVIHENRWGCSNLFPKSERSNLENKPLYKYGVRHMFSYKGESYYSSLPVSTRYSSSSPNTLTENANEKSLIDK